jgi:hypothetical protein
LNSCALTTVHQKYSALKRIEPKCKRNNIGKPWGISALRDLQAFSELSSIKQQSAGHVSAIGLHGVKRLFCDIEKGYIYETAQNF